MPDSDQVGLFVSSLRVLRAAAREGDEFSKVALMVIAAMSFVVAMLGIVFAAVWIWAVTR